MKSRTLSTEIVGRLRLARGPRWVRQYGHYKPETNSKSISFEILCEKGEDEGRKERLEQRRIVANELKDEGVRLTANTEST